MAETTEDSAEANQNGEPEKPKRTRSTASKTRATSSTSKSGEAKTKTKTASKAASTSKSTTTRKASAASSPKPRAKAKIAEPANEEVPAAANPSVVEESPAALAEQQVAKSAIEPTASTSPTEPKASPTSTRLYVGAIALVAFALGLTIGVVIGAASSNSDASERQDSPDVISPGAQPTAGVGQPEPAQPTSPTSDRAAATEALPPGVLARLSGGSGNTRSQDFALPGGAAKVRYEARGEGLTVRLLGVDTNDGESFYCPASCSREASLEKPAGTYYLSVDARQGEWNVEVAPG